MPASWVCAGGTFTMEAMTAQVLLAENGLLAQLHAGGTSMQKVGAALVLPAAAPAQFLQNRCWQTSYALSSLVAQMLQSLHGLRMTVHNQKPAEYSCWRSSNIKQF